MGGPKTPATTCFYRQTLGPIDLTRRVLTKIKNLPILAN